MTETITSLPYRVYRDGQELVASAYPDEGHHHNMTIAHKIKHEHKLRVGDLLVMDLRIGASVAHIAYRFEKDGRPVAVPAPKGEKS